MQPAIMIVEDDVSLRVVLKAALRSEGYAVRSTTSGRAASDLHLHPETNLLLIDWQRPDLDGRGLLAHLRAQFDHLPVISMSVFRFPLEVRKRVTHLHKPFELDELFAAVRDVLGHLMNQMFTFNPAAVGSEQRRNDSLMGWASQAGWSFRYHLGSPLRCEHVSLRCWL